MKRLIACVAALVFLLMPCISMAATSLPYTTLTEDNNQELIAAPDGYVPAGSYYLFDGEPLSSPQDITLGDDGLLYIADTGNKRVISCTTDGTLVRIYEGKKLIKKPNGICVRNGLLYVADSSLKEIVILDTETGAEVRRIEKPDEPLYGDNVRFEPLKIQVDSVGSMYVISNGNSNGVAMLSADGSFLGYHGANNTNLSIGQVLTRLLYTSDMMASVRSNIPNTPNNLTMDQHGLLYTATAGAGPDAVKKFSMAGVSMLEQLTQLDDSIVDVAVGQYDNIFAISSAGFIYEYSRDGRLLFFFGGADANGDRDYLFKKLVSICVDDVGNLYTLDNGKNMVQVFSPSAYANVLHEALNLYQNGLYKESRTYWERVLERNGLFDLAYVGLGEAYYKAEEWESALYYFRLGGDKEGYSDTFWELRAVWLQDHFVLLLGGLIVLCIIAGAKEKIKKHLPKLRVPRILKETAGVRRVLKNPADAFYGIKHEGTLSMAGAIWLYVVFVLMFLVGKYCSAFIFNSVKDGEWSIATDIAILAYVMVLLQVSLNLICSTRQSEAKAIDLFKGMTFALSPYFIIKPILTAVGYVLTYNEQFIETFGTVAMVLMCVALFVVMVREMQNYSYGETFRVIFLTIFVMFVITLSLLIIGVLFSQLFGFGISFVKEAYNAIFG